MIFEMEWKERKVKIGVCWFEAEMQSKEMEAAYADHFSDLHNKGQSELIPVTRKTTYGESYWGQF